MHPADVAAFVAEETGELKRRLHGRPDLRVDSLELHNDVVLDLAVDVVRYEVTAGAIRSGIVAGRQAAPVTTHFGRVPVIGTGTPDRLVLRIDCTNFDATPPTAPLLTADFEPLPAARWPRGVASPEGVVPYHAKYGRPFICRRGLREYHDHHQHADDPWDLHREGMRLADITIGVLEDLQRRWVSSE